MPSESARLLHRIHWAQRRRQHNGSAGLFGTLLKIVQHIYNVLKVGSFEACCLSFLPFILTLSFPIIAKPQNTYVTGIMVR